MANLAALAAGITLFCASIQTADARPRPRSSSFTANKTFGLGIMLGAPSAISGKYFLSADTALDFGVGVIDRRLGDRDGLHLHVDFLWHPVSLVNAQPFAMPLYFGIGGRIWDWNRNDNDNDLAVGLRVPIGIALDFNNVPIDIFLEAAFILDLVGYYNRAGWNGAIGIRYYFF